MKNIENSAIDIAKEILDAAKNHKIPLYLKKKVKQKIDSDERIVELFISQDNITPPAYNCYIDSNQKEYHKNIKQEKHNACVFIERIIPFNDIEDLLQHEDKSNLNVELYGNQEILNGKVRVDSTLSLFQSASENTLDYYYKNIRKLEDINAILEYISKENENYTTNILLSNKNGLPLIRKYLLERKKQDVMSDFKLEIKIKKIVDRYHPNQIDDILNMVCIHGNKKEIINLLNDLSIIENEEEEEDFADADEINTEGYLYFLKETMLILMKNEEKKLILIDFIKEIFPIKKGNDQKSNLKKEQLEIMLRDFIMEYLPNERHFFNSSLAPKKNDHPFIEEELIKDTFIKTEVFFTNDSLKNTFQIKSADSTFYESAMMILAITLQKVELGIINAQITQIGENRSLLIYLDKESKIQEENIKSLIIDYFNFYLNHSIQENYLNELAQKGKECHVEDLLKDEMINLDDLLKWMKSYWSSMILNQELPRQEKNVTLNKI